MTTPLVVFLAEDNICDVLLIRRAFEEHQLQFELLVAADGDEVTALLGRIGKDLPAPNLLMLDLNLPRMEGKELFRCVRAHPLCGKIPLLVATSSDSPHDHAWTSEFEVAHYFRKPSKLDEFLRLGAVVRNLTK